jgi:uncharacterized membrane protein YhaH (DUF805 family)
MEKLPEKVGLLAAINNFFRHALTFSGRSSRSEYWYVQVSALLVYAAFFAASVAFDATRVGSSFVGIITLGMSLGLILPNIAITSRRLRDARLSPYFFFLIFVPIIGPLALIVMLMLPSKDPSKA